MTRRLTTVVALFALALVIPAGASASVRHTSDQPDDLPGAKQIHFLYILASDTPSDPGWDVNGTIAHEESSFGGWMKRQTGGTKLRVDTYHGALDVTFVRLSQGRDELFQDKTFVRDHIEAELRQRGFNKPGKLYLGYYGDSTWSSCGLSSWNGQPAGNLALALPYGYPHGVEDPVACHHNSFAGPDGVPHYLEFAALHEMLHVIGFAPACAPHFDGAGHVNDSPTDLMYQGDQPWQPSVLDYHRDDYYRAGIPGCPDLSRSPYLNGSTAGGGKNPGGGGSTAKRVRLAKKTASVKGRFAYLSLSCRQSTACTGKVKLQKSRKHAKAYGRARFKIKARRTKRVKVKLTRAGRRLIKRHRRAKVAVVITLGKGKSAKVYRGTVKLKRAARRR